VHAEPWPVADPDLVKRAKVTMVVQVNGKVRARLEVPRTSRWPTPPPSVRGRGDQRGAGRRNAATGRVTTASTGEHHRLMSKHANKESDTTITIEPPRFDRPEVEIRASTRRKKTGTAHWSGSRIVVLIPARIKGRERMTFVDDLVERLMTQRPQNSAGDGSLEDRARALAERYNDGVMPSSVRWVKNQQARWASCSPASKEIRMSNRLRQCPEWVIDAVLVHELAHLQEVGHTPRFYEIADRFEQQEESAVFLEGYALGLGLRIEEGDVDVNSTD